MKILTTTNSNTYCVTEPKQTTQSSCQYTTLDFFTEQHSNSKKYLGLGEDCYRLAGIYQYNQIVVSNNVTHDRTQWTTKSVTGDVPVTTKQTLSHRLELQSDQTFLSYPNKSTECKKMNAIPSCTNISEVKTAYYSKKKQITAFLHKFFIYPNYIGQRIENIKK